jgi:hypothetical protein
MSCDVLSRKPHDGRKTTERSPRGPRKCGVVVCKRLIIVAQGAGQGSSRLFADAHHSASIHRTARFWRRRAGKVASPSGCGNGRSDGRNCGWGLHHRPGTELIDRHNSHCSLTVGSALHTLGSGERSRQIVSRDSKQQTAHNLTLFFCRLQVWGSIEPKFSFDKPRAPSSATARTRGTRPSCLKTGLPSGFSLLQVGTDLPY